MNSKAHRNSSGKDAELLALNYLKNLGYRFIESNYSTKFGEIDLIFKDNNTLVFVEVKYRKGKQILSIEETINKRKINRILKSAEIYINNSAHDFDEMRVDAVLIEEIEGKPIVRHIKNFY